jgi:uncharacterized protein
MNDRPDPQSNEAFTQRLQQLEMKSMTAIDNSLAFDRTPSELLSGLRRVTKAQDREIGAIQTMVDERAARGEIANIDCSMGCWFCCTQMVAVTIPEVLRLADHIRSAYSAEERENLNERMASYMKATEAWHRGDHSKKARHVCPLLRIADGACNVWQERPLICRGFNSTDHKMCITKRDDPVNDPDVPRIMGQFYAATSARTGLRRGLGKHGLDNQLHEMIPALMVALENEDSAERYLSGDPLFDASRVPGQDI